MEERIGRRASSAGVLGTREMTIEQEVLRVIASMWRPGLAVNTVPPDPEHTPDPEPVPPPPPDPIHPEPEPFPVPPLEPPPPPQLDLPCGGFNAHCCRRGQLGVRRFRLGDRAGRASRTQGVPGAELVHPLGHSGALEGKGRVAVIVDGTEELVNFDEFAVR